MMEKYFFQARINHMFKNQIILFVFHLTSILKVSANVLCNCVRFIANKPDVRE